MEALRLDLDNISVGGDKKVALVTGATGEPTGHTVQLSKIRNLADELDQAI